MNKFQTALQIAAGAAFALTCVATNAQSSTDLSRVEVTGQPLASITRKDVHATCKGIDAELEQSIGVLMESQHVTGEMRVDFELSGSEIAHVHSLGSTVQMRSGVNRAVSHISCVNGGQPQHYAFLLSMHPATDEELAAGSGPIVASVGPVSTAR